MKVLAILSQDQIVHIEFLQTNTIDFISQIVEEGLIFVFDDASQG
jgi:hypothetical protein